MTDHWLWRLDAHAWLEAADRELELARAQVGSRRTAVTHARRAAGMALNGALVHLSATWATRGWTPERCERVWGRSYIDHLRILAAAETATPHELPAPFDAAQSERCRMLLQIPVMPPTGLVRLAARKDEAASLAVTLADEITGACRALVAGSSHNQF